MSDHAEIQFPEPGVARLVEIPTTPFARGGEVLVRSVCSLLSTGTETTAFGARFSEGTFWAEYVTYPFRPGYATIGIVEQRGDGVMTPSPGDIVALRTPHASHHVVSAADCYPVPWGLEPERASWFALASIAFRGALVCQPLLGADILIVGAGPIGQMMVRWASASGARSIMVVDPSARRLAFAAQGGATVTMPVAIQSLDRRDLGEGMPDTIVDTTGNADVLAVVLALAPRHATIVMLGDPGRPEDQHLTHDVIVKGLRLVGAHDTHATQRWPGRAVAELFFGLVTRSLIAVDGMVTHRFDPSDCQEAYDLVDGCRDETLGVMFDWQSNRRGFAETHE